MLEFYAEISDSIFAAFKKLLSEKHLYQVVEIDLTSLRGVAVKRAEEICRSLSHRGSTFSSRGSVTGTGNPGPIRTDAEKSTVEMELEYGTRLALQPWAPEIQSDDGTPQQIHPTNAVERMIPFKLPTIRTMCDTCDQQPFNPIREGTECICSNTTDAWYYLSYRCQNCKGRPVRFMVRREGMKVRLAGRDPVEKLPTPKVLPKEQAKYYGDSQIAHHAGQTLAGIFLLRVFVEQFLRSAPKVKELLMKDPRAPGERIAETYQDTLPDAFKERFPSLRSIYSKLSEAIHAANADAVMYERSCAEVVKHFEARRIFEL